ncbi:MAG: hypothetical protein JJ863_03400 [Deltaproteobacteria bacterium]|nr:hypothetical protein [Deltaproteobacteria bacterium]
MRWLLALVMLGGCSLINDPDWNEDAPPFDGGHDMGDGGVPDGGDMEIPDGGDMSPDMGRPSELCGVEGDEDMDGLEDCADFDCVDDPACCGGGVPVFDVTSWNTTEINRMLRLPSSTPPTISTSDGQITRFDPNRTAAAMFPECMPLALGATMSVDFYPQPDQEGFNCGGAGQCDEFVQWVLAPADDIGVAGELLDELSVRVYPGLRVEVRRTGTVLDSWRPEDAAAPGTLMTLLVEVGPALDDAMVPVLRASIRIGYSGEEHMFSTDAIRISDLLDEPGCEEVPGLYMALQGQGTNAGQIGVTFAGTLSCPNPAQFAPPTDARPLTRVELDWDTSFTFGGIESPTIVSEGETDPFWHVMASGSNDQLELEQGDFRVGHAIGHASSSFWNQPTWPLSSEGARYGDDPPSCASMPLSCPSDPIGSVRDPFLLDIGEGNGIYAFAREVVPFMRPHGLYVAVGALNVTDGLTPTEVLRPGDVGDGSECESLRDPALVPTGDDDHYWLFYTCEQAAGRSTIRAARLDFFGSISVEDDTDAEVLAPGDVQAFGATAVRGPEPLVATEADRDVIRVWFIGLDRDFEASIGVAIADVKNLSTTTTAPELTPYPANPVLQPTDRSLDCATRVCEIYGFAVTDSPDDTRAGLLRMLVARRVQVPGAGRFFDLFPLEQAWDPLQ